MSGRVKGDGFVLWWDVILNVLSEKGKEGCLVTQPDACRVFVVLSLYRGSYQTLGQKENPVMYGREL